MPAVGPCVFMADHADCEVTKRVTLQSPAVLANQFTSFFFKGTMTGTAQRKQQAVSQEARLPTWSQCFPAALAAMASGVFTKPRAT